MLTATTNLLAVAGVFGIGLIIGLVVLTTAEEALTAVAKTAARDVSGSFWVGLLWQLLAVPLLAWRTVESQTTLQLAPRWSVVAIAVAVVFAARLVLSLAAAGRGGVGPRRRVDSG